MTIDETQIPRRPDNDKDFNTIKASDKNCIAFTVLSNVPNQTAYALFHPEYRGEDNKLNKVGKEACRQFFNYSKHREYMDAYRETLNRFLNNLAGIKGNNQKREDITDNPDKLDWALKELLNKAIALLQSDHDLDADTVKTITEVFKKLNILKDEVEITEAPRRYLPVRCKSECQYRLFCEQGIENGEIENECQYCRALAYAQENGYKYDPTNNLNIPTENE